MTINNPIPDRGQVIRSMKCKCGCRFSFAQSEARFVREPARFLFIQCPECGKECCKCLDDEPRDGEVVEFKLGGWKP